MNAILQILTQMRVEDWNEISNIIIEWFKNILNHYNSN